MNPITGIAACCARATSDRRSHPADKRDEFPPFHSITSLNEQCFVQHSKFVRQ
jgi:hypothetical protein